jgi:quercetin dioxygenase-like cupin family protein
MFENALMALVCTLAAQPEPPTTPPSGTNVIARSATTITGEAVEMPRPAFEVVITAVELPAGGVLPPHKHPWPRYAYVERGRLRVSYEAAGIVREFGRGEAVIEAIDQWHQGEAVGTEPVRIIVIDHVPPGQVNVVRR